jgi:hypothetical protein
VALFLACLGSGFLFHGFLTHRLPELATLVSLGATRSTALRIFVLQLFLLGICRPARHSCLFSFFFPPLSHTISELTGTTQLEVW